MYFRKTVYHKSKSFCLQIRWLSRSTFIRHCYSVTSWSVYRTQLLWGGNKFEDYYMTRKYIFYNNCLHTSYAVSERTYLFTVNTEPMTVQFLNIVLLFESSLEEQKQRYSVI